MANSFQNLKDYLLSLGISSEDKRYVLNFCKKLEYLDSLQKKAAMDTQSNINAGYGCVNSKICFVFNSFEAYTKVKSVLIEKLNSFKLEIWDVYLTFVDKTDTEYPLKYEYLAHELHAVGPSLLYVVTDGEGYEATNTILQALDRINAPHPQVVHNINVNDLTSTDPVVKQQLWNRLRYLINYKTIDIKE